MRRGCHQPFRVRVLGGLSAVAFAILGCDQTAKPPPPAGKSRSQAVAATGPAPAATASAAPAAANSAAPKKPRKLCEGQMQGAGRPPPKGTLARINAAGEKRERTELELAKGGFTWVNFWAAWCVPCKEEIPRLVSWQKKLGDSGKTFRVVFVSLDDDPRQLDDFLKAQPTGGLRDTYWLREGEERESWLGEVGVDPDPELPAHVLIDAKGRVRCTISGAVEDGDYAEVARLVAAG